MFWNLEGGIIQNCYFKFVLATWGSLRFHTNFRIFFYICKRCHWGFVKDCIELSNTDTVPALNVLIHDRRIRCLSIYVRLLEFLSSVTCVFCVKAFHLFDWVDTQVFFHTSIINRIVLLIFFSDILLLVYINSTKFVCWLCILQTCWMNIL